MITKEPARQVIGEKRARTVTVHYRDRGAIGHDNRRTAHSWGIREVNEKRITGRPSIGPGDLVNRGEKYTVVRYAVRTDRITGVFHFA
jgi:hypothetical protein